MTSWVDKVVEAVQDYNLFEPEEIRVQIERNPYSGKPRVLISLGEHAVYLTENFGSDDTYRWCDILTRAHNEDRNNKGETIGKEMLF